MKILSTSRDGPRLGPHQGASGMQGKAGDPRRGGKGMDLRTPPPLRLPPLTNCQGRIRNNSGAQLPAGRRCSSARQRLANLHSYDELCFPSQSPTTRRDVQGRRTASYSPSADTHRASPVAGPFPHGWFAASKGQAVAPTTPGRLRRLQFRCARYTMLGVPLRPATTPRRRHTPRSNAERISVVRAMPVVSAASVSELYIHSLCVAHPSGA